MYLFALMKFDQAPLLTKSRVFEKYRFYDEREWRLVPYITETDKAEVLPFLTEYDYNEYKKEHDGSSLLNFGVDFQYDDIHYVIVNKEEDVKKTREIVGDKIHIFTKEEVVEDMIGINHHEEILPTFRQSDLEASQRHLNRVFQELKDARKERKTKD